MIKQNPEENKSPGILRKAIGEAKYNIDQIKQAYGFNDQITSYRHKLEEEFVFPASINTARINRLQTKFQRKEDIGQELKNLETSAYQEVYIRELLNSKKIKNMETEFSIFNFVTFAPYQMNSNMTLFFHFLQYLIIFLLLKFIFVDLFNGLSSLNQGYFCQEDPHACFQFFFTETSVFNKIGQNHLILIVDILNLLFAGAAICFSLLFRFKQKRLYQQLNKGKISQEQYTILVENIPIIVGQTMIDLSNNLIPDYQKDIESIFIKQIDSWVNQVAKNQSPKQRSLEEIFHQTFLNSKFQKTEFSKKIITSISLCYDLRQQFKIMDLKNKIINRYQQLQPVKDRKDQRSLSQERQRKRRIIKQIKTLNKLQLEIMKNFIKNKQQYDYFKPSHFLGCAFVSFQYMHYVQHILQKAQENNDFLKFPGTEEKMKVSLAVNPKFINWRNLSIDQDQRKGKFIKSFLILLSALVLSFFAMFFWCFQYQQPGNRRESQKYYLIIGLCILITIASKMVHLMIRQIGKYRKYTNKQQQFYDILMLSVFSQFIITGVLYFVVTIALSKHILNYYGIVIEINSLIIVSCLIQIFLGIVDWPNYIKYFDIWWNYRNLTDHQDADKVKTFQGKFNEKYELAEFDLILKLTFYISQTYVALMYSYLSPTAVPILIVFLIIQYWIDQYNLFKRSKYPEIEINFRLLRRIMRLFDLSLVIWALGTLLFSIKIKDGILQSILNLCTLSLACGYFCMVIFQINITRGLFKTIEKPKDVNYMISQVWFQSTYWKQNPATMLRQQKIETGYNDDRDYYVQDSQIKPSKIISIDDNLSRNKIQKNSEAPKLKMRKIEESDFSY